MNKSNYIIWVSILVLTFCAGIAADQFYYTNYYFDYVKLNHTTSGIFIIQGKMIYTVTELETDLVLDRNLVAKH